MPQKAPYNPTLSERIGNPTRALYSLMAASLTVDHSYNFPLILLWETTDSKYETTDFGCRLRYRTTLRLGIYTVLQAIESSGSSNSLSGDDRSSLPRGDRINRLQSIITR